jgi:hypothetical protein
MLDIETDLIQTLALADVAGRLPEDLDARLPFTALRRQPGSTHVDPDTAHLEAVRLAVDTYGADDKSTFEAAGEVIEAIRDLAGTQAGGAFITSVRVNQSPYPTNDPARPDLSRYFAIVLIHAHPATTGS